MEDLGLVAIQSESHTGKLNKQQFSHIFQLRPFFTLQKFVDKSMKFDEVNMLSYR